MENEIHTISKINTTSDEELSDYLDRLKNLAKEAKEKGSIDKFFLIHEDDYFPYEYQWMPTCENTQLELTSTNLSSYLRDEILHDLLNDHPDGFYIPVPDEVLEEKRKEIPIDLGNLLAPAHFRSTKHFTVNTPLGYTHRYNQVKSKRKFIIIDSAQAFLDSPYHYSIGYFDAYLDVTHEFLPISKQAVILMSEENYNNSLNDKKLQDALAKRNVVVFTGDESLAINMYLTTLGVLPNLPGNPYMELAYDSEIQNILEQSIQDLANRYNLLYNQGHGNIDGKGGHFSDLYDEIHKGIPFFENNVIQFLKKKYPYCSDLFRFHQTFATFIKSNDFHKLIQKVGSDEIIRTFNEYNKEALINFNERRKAYIAERSSITKEQHDVFVKTIEAIKDNYNSFDNLNSIAPGYLQQQMISFFHSYDLKSQYDAAINILDFLEKNKDLCR